MNPHIRPHLPEDLILGHRCGREGEGGRERRKRHYEVKGRVERKDLEWISERR